MQTFVIKSIQEMLGPIDLEADTVLETLMDSLDLLELTLIIEDNTGVRIHSEDMVDWRTVGDVVKTVENKQSGKR